MSPNPSKLLRRYQVGLASGVLLSGLSLLPLFLAVLFRSTTVGFHILWTVHLFFHCISVALALMLIVHIIREMNDNLALLYLIVFFSICGLHIVGACLPWTSVSALQQDMFLARMWARAGEMGEMPLFSEASLPGGVIPVFSGFLQYRLNFLISAYNASYALILSAILSSMVFYKTHEEELSIWSALVLLSSPLLFWVAGQPTSVLPTACFLGLAYGSAIIWGEQRWKMLWTAVPGLSLGLACFLSAESVFLGPILLISLVGFYLSWKLTIRKTLLSISAMAIWALFAMSPWMFRNFIWSGKMFHPLFEGRLPSPSADSVRPEIVLGGTFVFFALIPLFRKSKHLQKIAPWARSTWFYVLVGLACSWRFYSHNLEEVGTIMMLPVLLLAAVGVEQLTERRPGKQSSALIRGFLGIHMILALICGGLGSSLLDAGNYFIGRMSKIDFLEENLEGYALVRQLNKSLPATAGVYTIGVDIPSYYLRRTFVGSTTSGEGLSHLLEESGSAREFAQRLILSGVTHLVVGSNPAREMTLTALSAHQELLWKSFLQDHVENVEAGETVSLLRVASSEVGGIMKDLESDE